jgi:hypothetical protein
LLKPTIQGKRAVTDGSTIHLARYNNMNKNIKIMKILILFFISKSYCASVRKGGESCSTYDSNMHYYNFHCPCEKGFKCQGTVIQLHPLLPVTTQSICKAA